MPLLTIQRTHGFTLIELLVVVSLVITLAAMTTVGARTIWRAADKASSIANLRELGKAALIYTSEHDGFFPPYREEAYDGAEWTGTRWWFGYESADSRTSKEGSRIIDSVKGPLGPYVENLTEGGACPTFLHSATLVPKYANSTGFGFGYNELLGPDKWIRRNPPEMLKKLVSLSNPSQTIMFASCAQVKLGFQSSPIAGGVAIEEFYLINEREITVHFRFGGKAAAVFADGHIDFLEPDESTMDPRAPEEHIGRFSPNGSTLHLQ